MSKVRIDHLSALLISALEEEQSICRLALECRKERHHVRRAVRCVLDLADCCQGIRPAVKTRNMT
jgi:hypothetical protein